ncbi:hypothetical protein MNEG_3613 [Monoraphidium neglectum]|uniref:Uncharacterized protein n=1 Tax=Monoraphidium neglectum TaxID=145388 RepID=A0A0D2NH41_9CHLO|nr:hypothetical protein MNEG_3613 [Monoraphidium neglectum]KIZ04346.1 hypothetical protein MNEG_3613 [Monoraphidium neglectum]|eukprot:XP_013903365.1 hypothetical protein MNEG_3613 [Monoraphidium neglectum]
MLQHGASSVSAGAAGPAMPAAAAILACLRELLIGADAIRADDARALAAASLPALRKLALATMEGASLEALVGAPWLRGLEDFAAVVRPALSAAAAAALAAGHLTSLTRLAIGGVAPLEDDSLEAAAALVSAPGTFAGLHELVLQNVQLGSIIGFDGTGSGEPLELLACMPMEHLTRLEVSGTCLGAHDIATVLPRATWIGRLLELRISNENFCGVQAFEALADLPMGGLRRMDICNCCITPVSLAALNEAVWLDGLQMLNLSDKFDSHEEVLLMERVLQVEGDPLAQLKGSQRLTACWSTSEHDDYMYGIDIGDEDYGKDIYDPAGAWQW